MENTIKRQIDELIYKHKTQAELLLKLINHENTSIQETEKYLSCRRFIVGFISDLKSIK